MERIDYSEVQALNFRVVYRRMALHRHNYHEFFYCYSGSGEQLVSGGIEPMRPGDLFLFPAEDSHRGSGTRGEDCLGAVVNFGDDLFATRKYDENDFLKIIKLMKRWTRERDHCLPLTQDGSRLAGEVIALMVDEYSRREFGYLGALKQLTMRLLLVIARHNTFPEVWLKELTKADRTDKTKLACAYIDHNYNRKITVESVCRVIDMSRSHFHAEFLRHTGLTMTQYVNRARCEAALKLLDESNLAPREVAEKCGFGSLCSFYRVLREETGRTPSDLRQPPTTREGTIGADSPLPAV
jgi:AraC-like DNA-binding protein